MPARTGAAEGAQSLVKAYLRTCEPRAYSWNDVLKTEELARILDADEAEQHAMVMYLCGVLGDLARRQDKAILTLNAPMDQHPWYAEFGNAQSILMGRLLGRKLKFVPEDIAALCGSLSRNETIAWGSWGKPLVNIIEGAAAKGELTGVALDAANELLARLRRSHGSDNARLAERLGKCLRHEGVTAGERVASRIEKMLLERTTFAEGEPELVDILAPTMVVPTDPQAQESVRFEIAVAPGPRALILKQINALLDTAVLRRGWQESAPEDGALIELMQVHGGEALAVWAASLAALSAAPIRYQFDGALSARFHGGYSTMVAGLKRGLADVRTADGATLASVCHSLSRVRNQQYIYPAWGTIAIEIARLAAPAAAGLDDRGVLNIIRLRERLARTEGPGDRAGSRTLDEALGIGEGIPFELGERWSDRAFADLLAEPAAQREAWLKAIDLGTTIRGSSPSDKWCKQADAVIAAIPARRIEEHLGAWFALVGRPRPAIAGGKIPGRDSSVPSERGANALRGLAFVASRIDSAPAARALGDLAMACFKMVPGVGARCIRPGTAALWGLSRMTTPAALSQLSRVRQLVKFGTAKKMLDASLAKLAAKLGVTTAELHEMAAPDFGLSPEGTLREEAGDFTLELAAGTGGAAIRVLDARGAERKTLPGAVKKEHAETLKTLKQAKADIDKMLEAQRARIDSMFVEDRVWSVSAWRERYIDHPLMGVLGRRLIWCICDDPKSPERGRAVLWRDDRRAFADLTGGIVEPREGQHVRLWHPIFAEAVTVGAWRGLIESMSIKQPVKQAHREVYPLTDAERGTGTYSNRYAAHVLKQHAFQELAGARGWTSKLRLMVDAEYPPPTRDLPGWGLRAEFWIESIGEDFGKDTTESGSFLYVATDQVRFYRVNASQATAHASGGAYTTRGTDAERNRPLALTEVPPLVFSEMMRDVDVFVGGASVGNNPQWNDGGPENRFREYWNAYSFGELGGSGRARRELLEKLIPRLKIARMCEFEDKFLLVKGTYRTYKIHLGSGNILMEPNDQYLCIVPSSSDEREAGGVFLPFEGDRTLAIILSKAFMLAEDVKIKDQSIVRQIKRA